MSCGIYKIENLINHKKYIGQSVNIQKRFCKHKNVKDNFCIHQAIQKYGKENFSFDIIEQCNIDELNQKECYWIDYYNSMIPNGYNMVPGGTNGGGLANGKEVEQYSLEGKLLNTFPSASQASRITNIEISNITYCCNNNPRYKHAGKFQWKFKDSNKIIKPIKQKVHSTKRKQIIQIETNKIFPSAMEAERQTQINHRHISEVCNGQRKTAGSYHWKYV